MKNLKIGLMLITISPAASAGVWAAEAPKAAEAEQHEHAHRGENNASSESSPAGGAPTGEREEEGEEGSTKIGPGKGIEAYDEHEGLKLSSQALRSFGIEVIKLTGSGPWEVPSSAKVHSGEEVNVFRVRDGFFRRIDFTELKKNQRTFTISSPDLKPGDAVAIKGLGFVRIAEIAASGGAPEGHSH